MSRHSFLICRALALLLALSGLVGASEAQQRADDESRIIGTWAAGTIRTTDVTLSQVKALLGEDADDATVCDYAFADVAGDGFYRLIVSLDYSGRKLCNTLVVISRDGTAAKLDAWNVEHIADVLVKEGEHDVLRVPQAITDYEGASCIAVVPIFYSLTGDSLVKATAEHRSDYELLLKKYTARPNNSTPPANPCTEAVVDKVQRLLGDATAGLAHAKLWMMSDNPSLRRKAVRVFEDIGDSEARTDLKVLEADKDQIVSQEAHTALTKLALQP